MSRNTLVLAAAGGSLLLLAGAFLFQALGYPPCPMCLWQRYPHAAAVLLGVPALLLGGALWPALGALAALTGSGLGLLHAGVEQGWWTVQTACVGGAGLSGLSGAELLSTEAPPLVMCDEIVWSFLGLSMAAWNAALSLALAAVWLAAARRTPRAQGAPGTPGAPGARRAPRAG
jgi:disulfide bond formation protein DsbB